MKALNAAAARKTSFIIGGLTAIEGSSVAIFHSAFLSPVLRHANQVPLLGWILALAVTAGYIAYAIRGLPVMAAYLLDLRAFKVWGPLLAVPSAILEEVFFRQSLMNAFVHNSLVVQVTVSALAFGLAHAFWAIRGGWRAFAGAVGSTALLGAALAIVFVASGRIVLPCVVAHFLINVVLEPWLLYAYVLRSQGKSARDGLTLTLRQPVT